MLLPKLLGDEHFDKSIEVDHAHRSLAPAKYGKSRAIIAKLHYFQIKELVLRLSWEKAPLQYEGRPVFIFPDLLPWRNARLFKTLKRSAEPGKFVLASDTQRDSWLQLTTTPARLTHWLKLKSSCAEKLGTGTLLLHLTVNETMFLVLTCVSRHHQETC